MNTKSKFQNKTPVPVFLVLWIGIFTLGWALSSLALFGLGTLLPEPLRHQMRTILPLSLRSIVIIFTFPSLGLIIAAAQAYVLNKTFSLRLGWLWIVLNPLAYALSFYLYPFIWYSLDGLDEFQRRISGLIVLFLVPAFFQWFLLRKHWRFAWLWILSCLLSPLVMFWLSDILDPATSAEEMMPIGFAHGLITGFTIVLMDWLTKRANKTLPTRDKT